MHTAQNVRITRPGSARLFAGISVLGASIATHLTLMLASDALRLGETERTFVLIVTGVAATFALYWAITGWIKLGRSKSWKISRSDALALASYLQHSEAATDFVRNHLREIGKVELEDLTYEDVEDMDPLLREATENELLSLKR